MSASGVEFDTLLLVLGVVKVTDDMMCACCSIVFQQSRPW